MPMHLVIEGLAEFKGDVGIAASQVKSQVKWAMVQSVNAVKKTAQDMVPYKTGTLRRSIFTDVRDSGFTGIVAQDSSIAPYGVMMEYGTKAHEITPKSKQALFWPGAAHPVKRVMHPGTAARPYMAPALEKNIDVITGYFKQAMQNLITIMKG